MQRLLTAGLALLLITCNGPRATKRAAAAADLFTDEHAQRALKASVAGVDCAVLLIDIETSSTTDLIESIHYGGGEYKAFGGVEELAQKHGFRAVVYRDADGNLQTYGATTRKEAKELRKCR